MRIMYLSKFEEIVLLTLRVENERHKVLFVKGEPYHDKAVKKIKGMQKRIVKLGGVPDLKIEASESNT